MDRKINLIGHFKNEYKNIAFVLLMLWCLLPLGMAFYAIIAGVSGAFPSVEELTAQGLRLGYMNYSIMLETYAAVFRILGLITLVYSIIAVILCWDNIANINSMKERPWYYLFLGVLIWAIFSSLLSENFARAFWGGHYRFDGLSSYFIYAGVFICASVITEDSHRTTIINLFIGVISALAVLMIVQNNTDTILDICFPSHNATVFNQFNHFGYMLCLAITGTIGLFLYDKTANISVKLLYALLIVLLTYTLLSNDTFGAYLAAVSGCIIIYILYAAGGRKLSAPLFIPIAIILFLSILSAAGTLPGANGLNANIKTSSVDLFNIFEGNEAVKSAGTGRMQLWMDTAERIGQRPLFGFGPEGFYDKYAISGRTAPHNEYLQITGFLGFPAIIMYLSALVTLLIHQLKRFKELSPLVMAAAGMAISYLISACFGNPMFNTYPYFWIVLGLSCGQKCENDYVFYIKVRQQKTSSTRFIAAIFSAVLIIICSTSYALCLANEKANEHSDIEGVRNAILTAQVKLDASETHKAKAYVYNFDSFELVELTKRMSVPTGKGTDINGHTSDDYLKSIGDNFGYTDSQSYFNKVILVNINPDAEYPINLSWEDIDFLKSNLK